MAESNRDSFIRSSDAVRRSATRNSHYSHASTQSWVLSTLQNPPPPPEESPPLSSPVRTPRPLPHPQLHPQHQPVLLPTNADRFEEEEEEEMNIDPSNPGMETRFRTEGPGRSPRLPPVSQSSVKGIGSGKGRSFVGGVVNGLRRLPRAVMRYGDKRKYGRRETFGSGATVTSGTGMTTGNTLPLYASNPPTPVAGPSNTQYVMSLDMPVPHPADDPPPVILGPSLSQRHRNPSLRVTPPSMSQHEDDTAFRIPLTADPPPRFFENLVESPRLANTVTIYQLPGQEGYPEEPPLPLPTPTPNRRSMISQHQQPVEDATPAEEVAAQSPVLAHPAPASDYRKMTLSSSPLSPGTLTTSLATDPSFSSQLSPVKRFLLNFYHLPWIAPERVTADYRPRGHHGGGHGGVKKPMSSWYRGVPGVVLAVKAGSGELDLLSSGTGGSRRASTNGTSSTPLASPAMRVRHHSSDQHRHREHNHRRRRTTDEHHGHGHGRRRRDNTSASPQGIEMQMRQHVNASPIIPAVYPYAYPYPFPYPAFSAPPPLPPPQRAIRGPRNPHHTQTQQTYPHGYAPQPSPPMYVVQSPSQTNASVSVEGMHGQQVLSPVYVPMQLMPGYSTQGQASPRAGTPSASGASPPAGPGETVEAAMA